MNKTNCIRLGFTLAGVLVLVVLPARADTFGSGGNIFTIDFVDIGNPGNADDVNNPYNNAGDQGTPFGGVGYTYRMGTYEISEAQITKATASGLANVTAGAQPAANMTWYEMAAFVNFLNTSTGHHAAYQINAGVTALTLWSSAEAWQLDGEDLYRHKDAFYFLPSEDEWYKAAYHKNDGATANYWDYATGSNSAPTPVASGTAAGTAVYEGGGAADPAAVNNAGGLSSYGTMGQDGNVWEKLEGAYTARTPPIDTSSDDRVDRGGAWFGAEVDLRSSYNNYHSFSWSASNIGFRVASVPEPNSGLLLLGSGLTLLLRRRHAAVPSFRS